MKVIYTKNDPDLNGYIHVGNGQMLNLLVEDNEADEIIVENMLSQVPFSELPAYYHGLLSKLRVGGKLIIYYLDFYLLSMQYEKGHLTIKEVSELVFTENVQCLINESVITSLIGDTLKIEKKDYNSSYLGIITGVRE